MSLNVHSETNEIGVSGWRIRAVVYVPKTEMHNEIRQLAINRFVSMINCPTLLEAKKIGLQLEEHLYKMKQSYISTKRNQRVSC